MVALIHFLNNLLKLGLFWKNVGFSIIRRFGVVSIMGALLGAYFQFYVYSSTLKIFLGIVLVILGGRELLPQKRSGHYLKGLTSWVDFRPGCWGVL
ncbi:MAG: Sulfite exporter TauE/SafE [Candidatus Scalindua rubra]|uniref:Probable membrane transporter protein n=1 Tax=Candidatus Scalindua rubra TaxID=1872076 RepID=A0A1E3XC04_9BACT|nr:MAG: Sulfite exporter TauE/SafE [Candidatus Scalindua rubra]